MIVTLLTVDRIHSVTLPRKISGQYWLSDTDAAGRERRLAGIEGTQGRWILKSNLEIAVLDDEGRERPLVELAPSGFHSLRYRSGALARLTVEAITREQQDYRKYAPRGDCRLSIGRGEDNQIAVDNRFVSARHACLSLTDGRWHISDRGSRNGTFVNEYRVSEVDLRAGDVVFIMGVKIIVGSMFLAINNPNGQVSVSEKALPALPAGVVGAAPRRALGPVPFYCSPRLKQSVRRETIAVDAPPAPRRTEEAPLSLLYGPAVTMGLTAVLMGALSLHGTAGGGASPTAALPTLAMAFSMLAGALLWPLLTKRSERKRRRAAETERQMRYRAYLQSVRAQIAQLAQAQRAVLLENHPPLAEHFDRTVRRGRRLWERSPEQDDFLQLRLGLGSLPLAADLRYPEAHFSLENDDLQTELAALAGEPTMLTDVPVTHSLRSHPFTGIIGPRPLVLDFARGLVLQTVSLHSYEDIKLVFLLDPAELGPWAFARWLPHTWDSGDSAGAVRFFAVGESACKALSSHLERVLAGRAESDGRATAGDRPHYVLLVDYAGLAGRMELLRTLRTRQKTCGFSVLFLNDALRDLPKECSTVIELSADVSAVFDKDDVSGDRTRFRAESAAGLDAARAALVLANTQLDIQSERYALPSLITFLGLFGVGKVEHLNALTRWKENNPANSLQAPVGLMADGEIFTLDLHEKFHGPHGLIAGMTGSGKSEFIMTFILSLAVNYRPDEVAFILIDYKGGGLAGAFEDPDKGLRLPHLAGTITNLDGAAVKRSLISIQSELRRRQRIFREARPLSNEGTIDIYKYQMMYRSGLVTAPVPHLFIISDEFAELKTQQPEFMEQLISAARIGRGLGIHLILATQKPSGVVDDQIWSNSRARVCLKVQEKADSMDMLKRPDAVYLSETGRFYLQVGFHELFALGQAAWCGAPYVPSDEVERSRDDGITVVDHLGRAVAEAKPKPRRGPEGHTATQTASVVQYLSALAEEEHVSAHPLWLPAIPPVVLLGDLRRKYAYAAEPFALDPVIGEYDDPFNQRQGLLTLPLSREGNAVIFGAAGSGKTTLLNTLLCGLLSDYGADRLHVYLIDLGAETLRAFEQAPQVGGVLFSQDEERIRNLLRMLVAEIADRKRRFAEFGGEFASYCAANGEPAPAVLLIVRNYLAFIEQFESYEDGLLQIAREGVGYGVHVILTGNAPHAVRYRMLQNFRQTIVLQLNDRSDYFGALGNTDGVYPSKLKGRGLVRLDTVYEFQSAVFGPDTSQKAIRAFCAGLAGHGRTAAAPPVPVLPARVDAAFVRGAARSPAALPVGVDKQSLQLVTIDLQSAVAVWLSARDLFSLAGPARGLAETAALLPDAHTTVWDAGDLFPQTGAAYECVERDFEARVRRLFEEMVRRNNTYKTASGDAAFPMALYIIVSLGHLLEQLSGDGQDKLRVLMEKAEGVYNIRFAVCDTVHGFGAVSSDGWYKRHMAGADGVWVGGGLADQYVFPFSKVSAGLYEEVEDGFGYVLRRGRPILSKLLTALGPEGSEPR
ncbi:MAG: type VII secretion protein EssC [Oscillospiraceae bacterium]|nr:type VII secretion protein EssC [Oscillospiraceae bacterium]